MTRTRGDAAHEGLPREVWMVAIVVIFGAVMSILDTTIVNVALESLRVDLHAPLSTIQWVTTGYLLALAAVIPLTGWAAERFGPRRVWMTAVTGFVVTSGLCGLAWSAESLIVFRVLQGLAGGMIMPVGMITLAQTAGPQRMGRVMGIVGVPMLLAPVLGPVLGGLLVTHLSWRWIFYVNLPIGLVGLALAWRLLPSTRTQGHAAAAGERVRLDVRGLLLLSPGVALVVFGLSEVSTHGGVTAPSAYVPLLLGAAMVAAFVPHALRTRWPLVDIRLFRSFGFSAAAATTFLVGAALFGAMILLPLYYQVARGENALTAGLLIAPQGIGAALGMNIAGRLTDRIGAGRVVLGGLAVLVVGTIPFTQVSGDTSYWLLGAALVVRGFGLGGTMMPAMAAAYATLDKAAVPRATPMLNVVQRVGGSLGSAILAVILQRNIVDDLPHASGAGALDAAQELPPAIQARLAEPLAAAFASTYWWTLGLIALALVPAALLARAERGARRARFAAEHRGGDAALAEAPEVPGTEPAPQPAGVSS
jgi:EmrB/QacA subfamily drug resistance transporter